MGICAPFFTSIKSSFFLVPDLCVVLTCCIHLFVTYACFIMCCMRVVFLCFIFYVVFSMLYKRVVCVLYFRIVFFVLCFPCCVNFVI